MPCAGGRELPPTAAGRLRTLVSCCAAAIATAAWREESSAVGDSRAAAAAALEEGASVAQCGCTIFGTGVSALFYLSLQCPMLRYGAFAILQIQLRTSAW